MRIYWFDTRFGMIEVIAGSEAEARRVAREDRGIANAVLSHSEPL